MGVKLPVHFHCVLHAKKGGEGVQKACRNTYVIIGTPRRRAGTKMCSLNQDRHNNFVISLLLDLHYNYKHAGSLLAPDL